MELEEAARAFQRAKKTYEDRRAQLADAIVSAVNAGRRQNEIVRITGYTRERIRQIADESAKEGPVDAWSGPLDAPTDLA